ncbi:hypothetical protein SBOR_0881 [Sclerotinia borealis F-4128]|uniref:Uncharacterized protein n=1 Tax=Sclerotinia borealis (strain F-4128) TaxID=1432307 RepID=W9CRC6_SCLBF|nr:hypothetical protein SBOR_0881 [Sclerotinia borealis F-4128]
MSTTPPQPTKTGPQDFNVASSIASASSAYQLYYVRFYSPTNNSKGPSSYALGYRPRWGNGPIETSTTIYIACAPGTAGRAAGKAYRETNITAEKRERNFSRADVYWLGKINNVDRLVEIMGDVGWIGDVRMEKSQKIWCERVALWINWDRTWVVAGRVNLPKDKERVKGVWTLGN